MTMFSYLHPILFELTYLTLKNCNELIEYYSSMENQVTLEWERQTTLLEKGHTPKTTIFLLTVVLPEVSAYHTVGN